jgi:glycosyltransferase involved in cell wall biosynthesis
VLIDAHMLGRHETGNERYIHGLLSGLANHPDVRVAAAVTPDTAVPDELARAPIEWVNLPSRRDWPRLMRHVSHVARRWGADVLHATYVAPFGLPCPLVLAVHDVSFRRFPELSSLRDRLLFRTLVPYSLRRAHAVVTCSNHARLEIHHFFPSISAEVHAVPLAASSRFRAPQSDETLVRVRRRYGTGDRFVLTAGTAHPRKNLARLVRAFATVVAQHPQCRLVVCGASAEGARSIRQVAAECGVQASVVFPGYLDDDELTVLYAAAAVFAYPSLYEGFGLPVLEAMASGTPVVASHATSLPEVAGDAALLVDPLSTSAIASAISRVLDDRKLADDLAARGLARARAFSWSETANRTAAVYRQVTTRSALRAAHP